MLPAQRWKGVWATQFEAGHFCPNATKPCSWEQEPRYFIRFNRRTFKNRPQVAAQIGHAYAVDFQGRRFLYQSSGPNPSYVILVDRLNSMRDLGRLSDVAATKEE
jgi:hypothetical protein